jgi:hypothetical protein
MSDLIGSIPYENIENVRAICDGLPCSGNNPTNIQVLVDFIETPGLQRDERANAFVTLELNDPALNGVYRIKSARNTDGFRTIAIDISDANIIVKKSWTGADLSGLSGQIFFGKRSTGGATGGTVTQILNTDIGKAIGAMVLAVAAIFLLRYLLKD